MLKLNELIPPVNNQSDLGSSAMPAASANVERSSNPGVVVPPPKAFYNVMQRKISGQLTIREVGHEGILWHVYVGQGELHLATGNVGELERLRYILVRTRSPLLQELVPGFVGSAYDFLYEASRSSRLDSNAIRRLLRLFSQEALIHIMALPQAVIQFERSIGLEELLVSLPLRELITPIAPQIGAWQRLRPHITSPLQRLQVVDSKRLQQELAPMLTQSLTSQITPPWTVLLQNQPCLYELAAQLDIDLLQLANVMVQGVKQGILGVTSFNRTEIQEPKATIACIDDSVTVQRNVRLILEAANYQVLGLQDPLQALSQLVKERPALILMDISMPNLDGYELSRLLRQSSILQNTPIVMLTGRDGFVDKVRARVVGAVDYVTKPFDAKTLMDVVAKHLKLEVLCNDC